MAGAPVCGSTPASWRFAPLCLALYQNQLGPLAEHHANERDGPEARARVSIMGWSQAESFLIDFNFKMYQGGAPREETDVPASVSKGRRKCWREPEQGVPHI